MGAAVWLLWACLAAGAPAAGSEPSPKVDRWLAKGAAALEDGDIAKALKLSSKAVVAAPDDARGYSLRGHAGVVLTGIVSGEFAQLVDQQLLADFERVVALAPDSPDADFARTVFAGRSTEAPLVVSPTVSCSEEAGEALAMAEDLFGRRDAHGAMAGYERAIELCPEDPVLWVYSGDAAHLLGDLRQARMRYRRAIELDPCFAMAHRFLADLRTDAGEYRGAWESLTSAVACNPTYDVAWADLGGIQTRTGGTLARWRTGAVDGSPDGAVWLAYTVARASPELLDGTAGASVDPGVGGESDRESPIGRAELAAHLALAVLQELQAASEGVSAPLWDHLREARDAGFLREAIYVHLLDRDLANDFAIHRAAHRERLVEYVRSLVAPTELPAR